LRAKTICIETVSRQRFLRLIRCLGLPPESRELIGSEHHLFWGATAFAAPDPNEYRSLSTRRQAKSGDGLHDVGRHGSDSLQIESEILAGIELQSLASPLAGPFTFLVPGGSCLTITGPSGSGKSLLLRLIADLDAGEGIVRLGAVERSTMTARHWRACCPYVAATPGFWAQTAADHFPVTQQARAKALAATMLFDESRFDAPISNLSTGERQRIALTRALILDSPVLLLDEPTGPLDREATMAIAEILAQRMAAGVSLLLVTHDQSLAARLGTERREMRDRKLVA
jgi:putative ABC transport system ATP-binding protein